MAAIFFCAYLYSIDPMMPHVSRVRGGGDGQMYAVTLGYGNWTLAMMSRVSQCPKYDTW